MAHVVGIGALQAASYLLLGPLLLRLVGYLLG